MYIEEPTLWNNYHTTKAVLVDVYEKTDKQVYCAPVRKVVKGKQVIGILTQTQQFVKINQPVSLSSTEDELEIDFTDDYLEADIDIGLGGEDTKRFNTIRNIVLESQYYSVFRTTMRILLDDPHNAGVKSKIRETIHSDNKSYDEKIENSYYLLLNLGKSHIVFDEIDKKIQAAEDIYTCFRNCENKPSCISSNDGTCSLVVPRQNLHDEKITNKLLYHTRIADELVRYPRIREFILDFTQHLNTKNVDYKVNKDEILLVESYIKNEFFNELTVFDNGSYHQNITFEMAKPEKSQNYSNKGEF
jgi:hypothetical protein